MKRILVSDNLSEQGLESIRSADSVELDYRPGLDEAALAEAIKGAHGLVIRSGSRVTARVIEAADALEVIGRAGIGVDNVDLEAASKRGIVVMNTPTGNAVTTAEHTVSLMMALARWIPRGTATLKAGEWAKKQLKGRELADKTLAVIGLGTIGRIVADRAQGLKMKVIGFDPVLTAERDSDRLPRGGAHAPVPLPVDHNIHLTPRQGREWTGDWGLRVPGAASQIPGAAAANPQCGVPVGSTGDCTLSVRSPSCRPAYGCVGVQSEHGCFYLCLFFPSPADDSGGVKTTVCRFVFILDPHGIGNGLIRHGGRRR